MIVEPAPTDARSRRGRAIARLGLALPPLLLVLVIGAGMVGQRETRHPAAPSSGPVASPVAPGGVFVPDGEPGLDPAFPRVAAGVAVRPVPDVLAARADGAPIGLIAVAGYLSMPQPPTDCGAEASGPLGAIGPLCERRALLTQQPPPPASGEQPVRRGPHLHITVPVGVRLPPTIARTMAGISGAPLAAILVGRFDPVPEGDCQAAVFRCDEGFRAEAVAWVDGAAFPSRPVIDAGVDGNPTDWVLRHRGTAEIGAVGWAGRIFVSALVRPSTLARIDPDAAAAIADGRSAGSPRGLVWYVRGLATDGEPPRYPLGRSPPVLRWIVLDDVTGETIARGGDAQPAP